MNKLIAAAFLTLLGFGLAVWGLYLVSLPLALIVSGVALVVFGLLAVGTE